MPPKKTKFEPKKKEEVKTEETPLFIPKKEVKKHYLDRYYNPVTGSRFEALGDL